MFLKFFFTVSITIGINQSQNQNIHVHITDTQNHQVHFGVFEKCVFIKALSTASYIKETPKIDLGISGVCYMHTMLKEKKSYDLNLNINLQVSLRLLFGRLLSKIYFISTQS